MYLSSFKKSWIGFLKNPILIIPDVMFFIGVTVLGIIISIIGGFWDTINNAQFILPSREVIMQFLQQNWVNLLISLIIFGISTFFVGLGTITLKYIMMRDVVRGKQVNFFSSNKKIKDYLSKVIMMKVIMFLIMVPIFLIMALLFYISYEELNFLIRFICLAAIILTFILVKLAFLFNYPALFLKKNTALKAIKDSFNLFRYKFSAVFTCWLMLALVTFIFGAISGLFLKLGIILSIFIGVWGELFLFFVFQSEIYDQ